MADEFIKDVAVAPPPVEVPIDDMIKEVARELRMREDVYGRAAKDGKMSAVNVHRIEVMRAVLATLEEIAPERRKQKGFDFAH